MKVFEVNGNLYEDSAFNRRLVENAKAEERAKVFDECISYFEEHASEVYQHICAKDFILDSLEEIERGLSHE